MASATLLSNILSNSRSEIKFANKSNLKIITLDEVSFHDSFNDCWIIIYDRVYDITDFLNEHPGGEDTLLEYAGRDGTLAFRGFGHSENAFKLLEKYLIGKLPLHEQIFRKPDGIFNVMGDIPS